MRIVRFRYGRRTRYGIVEHDDVVEITGNIFGRYTITNNRHLLKSVRLLPPVTPSQMFGPGLNFADHLQHASGILGVSSMPDVPQPWHKAASAIIGPGEAIVIPYDSPTGIQYEGECIAVIGRRARRLNPQEAWDYILGYTCGNDVSERTWQSNDMSFWRAKGADTFSPIGPWIDTDFDPRKGGAMVVRLNGKEVQRASVTSMYFDFGRLVSFISQWVTLAPGDMIWSGTTGEPQNMHPGDTVEVEVEGIGVLSNPVAEEKR